MSTETFAANATTGCAGSQPPTFQDIVMNLQHYWAAQGCVVLQPYDGAVGAGTNHTGNHAALVGPRHVAHLLRAGLPPSNRRPLRREP